MPLLCFPGVVTPDRSAAGGMALVAAVGYVPDVVHRRPGEWAMSGELAHCPTHDGADAHSPKVDHDPVPLRLTHLESCAAVTAVAVTRGNETSDDPPRPPSRQ